MAQHEASFRRQRGRRRKGKGDPPGALRKLKGGDRKGFKDPLKLRGETRGQLAQQQPGQMLNRRQKRHGTDGSHRGRPAEVGPGRPGGGRHRRDRRVAGGGSCMSGRGRPGVGKATNRRGRLRVDNLGSQRVRGQQGQGAGKDGQGFAGIAGAWVVNGAGPHVFSFRLNLPASSAPLGKSRRVDNYSRPPIIAERSGRGASGRVDKIAVTSGIRNSA